MDQVWPTDPDQRLGDDDYAAGQLIEVVVLQESLDDRDKIRGLLTRVAAR